MIEAIIWDALRLGPQVECRKIVKGDLLIERGFGEEMFHVKQLAALSDPFANVGVKASEFP